MDSHKLNLESEANRIGAGLAADTYRKALAEPASSTSVKSGAASSYHMRSWAKRASLSALLLFAILMQGCDNPVGPEDPPIVQKTRNDPPAWLVQGWAWPDETGYGVRTYDFTRTAVAGLRSVEIRNWQYLGTLGWQSNQNYTYATYTATDNTITITTATGYQEEWDVIERTETTVTLGSTIRGNVRWYNCSAGWPYLIKASTRGCTGI